MKIRDEKGSMAVYVTIALVSMLFILMTIFLTSSNLRKNQIKTALKVKETYEADNGRADKIYKNLEKKLEANYIFKEEFDSTINYKTSATTHSTSNGIVTLNSSSNDPMVFMNNVTSFSPIEYRYIDVKYKTTASSNMGFFMTENPADGTYVIFVDTIGDGEWHIATFDLWSNVNVKNREKITGWRWDWTSVANSFMEVDYIRIRK